MHITKPTYDCLNSLLIGGKSVIQTHHPETLGLKVIHTKVVRRSHNYALIIMTSTCK